MKTDNELILLGLESEKTRVVGRFNKVLKNNEQYDIIGDDRDWTELRKLKEEYDEIQYKILQLVPPSDEIPF